MKLVCIVQSFARHYTIKSEGSLNLEYLGIEINEEREGPPGKLGKFKGYGIYIDYQYMGDKKLHTVSFVDGRHSRGTIKNELLNYLLANLQEDSNEDGSRVKKCIANYLHIHELLVSKNVEPNQLPLDSLADKKT